jgi:hypothetical protein
MMCEPGAVGDFAEGHVTAFNAAVAAGDFAGFLDGFTDDAVIRFENVPGAGWLEYSGRPAYEAAYAERPPDDEMDIAGTVEHEGGDVIIPFAWRRDPGSRGIMRLTRTDDRISKLIVMFLGAEPVIG